jgi:tRNA A-37 threonylcarbamoyl transferase component Bud32
LDVSSRGRFLDLQLLGQGGMASVYRARDSANGRKLALKALRIDSSTRHREERIAQFHREYRTLVEIAHPRVIQVYDYGIDADGPYYTMKLLDGADLSALAPLPWRDACALLRDVCSSLALLHSRGYLHRDVSPLNVRCTADGRAKLIDFGAMAAMGVSTLAIGTPPCVPPEALTRQPLDGRADLFALGATLYFTLTGRQAYPARNFTELRIAHQQRVIAPSAYADIPPALDRLVLSLLSLDAMARPRHAAEVMDRLTTIADLGPIEPVSVSRAYLNTPALVGREAVMAEIAALLAEARSGDGRIIRVHAARGGGRSRILQTLSVDARLSGVLVLQADASDAASGAYGVLRALLRALAQGSERAAKAIAADPELATLSSASDPDPNSVQRDAIFKALERLIAETVVERPLLIAVDDIEDCDEPSLAALLTLVAHIRKRAVALAYADAEADTGTGQSALRLLRELSRPVELPPLGLGDVEVLLASVFGAVPNLQIVPSFIFERAFGNPRASLELAQALVDQGLARYELGSWSLPGQIDHQALPASLLEVRGAKLARLSPDALELAQLVAIAHPHPLSLEELRLLSEHRDAERIEGAREALVEARVLAAADGGALVDRSWSDVVRATLSEAPLRALLRRMALLLTERGASAITIGRYWLQANEVERAIDALCGALRRGTLVEEPEADYPELLQECINACARLQRPPMDEFLLARELMALSDRVVVRDHGACFRAAIARLRWDSGLTDYEALPPSADRLERALTAAQARYDAAADSARVLPPIEAIRALVETVYSAASHAAVICDLQMLEQLPDLTPFEVLSPAIAGVREAIAGQRALIGARYEEALAIYAARLDSLETAQQHLSPAQIERARLMLHYALGSLQAGLSIKGALEHAHALDQLPHGQIMAAAVRESYYVRLGNTRVADEWRHRMELLQVQLRRPYALKIRQTTQQLECSGQADDLEETKRNMEVLQELCVMYPSALPYVHYARAEYERIRGDYTRALQHVRECLAIAAPGGHAVWPWAAACEIECVRLLGRAEEARALGEARVHEARAAGLRIMAYHVELFLALAEADCGDFAAAVDKLDRNIEYRERFGMSGLNVGWAYDARTVVALRMRDRASFEHCLEQCALNYAGGRDNPALAARYERLLQEARSIWREGERGSNSLESAVVLLSHAPDPARLVSGADAEERAHTALASLLRAAGCARGQLFLLRQGHLVFAAGAGATLQQRTAAEGLVASVTTDDRSATAAETLETSEMSAGSHADSGFETVLLSCRREGGLATIGALSLEGATEIHADFYAIMRAVCGALIDAGDVQPSFR